MAGKTDRMVVPHLRDGETIEVTLRGLIAGYTRWSTIGTVIAVVTAFSIVTGLEIDFLPSLVILAASIVIAFMVILYLVGRPMAARHDPRLSSPYVVLALTNRRLLLVEQGSGRSPSSLIEEAPRSQVSRVRYTKGGLLSPQRLGYQTQGAERSLEFPRLERVALFVEGLKR